MEASETADVLLENTRHANHHRYRRRPDAQSYAPQWANHKESSRRSALRLLIQTLSQASPLDVKGVKLEVSTADLVAIVREGRERG
jgi:hypothetical protein